MGGRFGRRSADEMVTCETAAEWRAWLRAHYLEPRMVWLVFYKKHTGEPCPTYDEAVEEALCWGWIDSVKKRIDDERYAFKFTPRRPGSAWSPSNKRRVEKLVDQGRMMPAGQKLVNDAKADGSWETPTSADSS